MECYKLFSGQSDSCRLDDVYPKLYPLLHFHERQAREKLTLGVKMNHDYQGTGSLALCTALSTTLCPISVFHVQSSHCWPSALTEEKQLSGRPSKKFLETFTWKSLNI